MVKHKFDDDADDDDRFDEAPDYEKMRGMGFICWREIPATGDQVHDSNYSTVNHRDGFSIQENDDEEEEENRKGKKKKQKRKLEAETSEVDVEVPPKKKKKKKNKKKKSRSNESHATSTLQMTAEKSEEPTETITDQDTTGWNCGSCWCSSSGEIFI